MPINLGNYILRRHQNNPGRLFFGDPYAQDAFADQHGVAAIQRVYDDLVGRGLVESSGLVSIRGQGVSTYKISPTGRTAVIGPDFDPD